MKYRLPGSRRRWAAFFLGAALLLAAVLVPQARQAAAHGGAVKGPVNQWRVLPPISYNNLTLFPVEARDAGPGGDYITLDEGIRRGTVQITEKGGGQTARRTDRYGNVRQVQVSGGGSASVNQLALVNRSGKKLLLLAGEVVVGGQQDRIVQDDLIVPPVSVPVRLDVFCVEHGRWSHRTAGYSSPSAPRRAGRTAAQAGGGAPVERPAPAPSAFTSLGAISHPKLRAAAQDKKEQGEVWKEVGENNRKLGTDNSTDTYQEVYANEKVQATMEQYLSALQREMPTRNIVGVIVARNGQLVWADVFADASLFARYWPKLLKSYVVDAMGDQQSDMRPSLDQARAYLGRREGEISSGGRPGVYRLVKTEHTDYAVFQLEDTSLASPLRVHFNKIQR